MASAGGSWHTARSGSRTHVRQGETRQRAVRRKSRR